MTQSSAAIAGLSLPVSKLVGSPALEDAHVVSAFERSRIGATREVHAALRLAKRSILVLLEPGGESVANRRQVLGPVL